MPKVVKRKKKTKKVKIVPDPDGPYKEQLHAEYYIPKLFREQALQERLEVIANATMAFTVAAPEGQSLDCDEQLIPMAKVPFIIRSLNLCPSREQFKQINAMIAATRPGVTDPDTQLITPPTTVDNFADRKRLDHLLLDLLDTRVLAYDPQVLVKPHPSYLSRVSSVMYMADEVRIQSCFESLLVSCGGFTEHTDSANIRCIPVDALKLALDNHDLYTGEDKFSDLEMDELLFSFQATGEQYISEDAFLLAMLHVQ